MGQKVSPTGFRLGVTEDWRSRGFTMVKFFLVKRLLSPLSKALLVLTVLAATTIGGLNNVSTKAC